MIRSINYRQKLISYRFFSAEVRSTIKFTDDFLLSNQTLNSNSELFTISTPSHIENHKKLLETIGHIPQKVNEIKKLAKYDHETYKDDLEAAVHKHSGLFVRQLKIEEEQQTEALHNYEASIHGLLRMGRGTGLKRIQKTLLQWYEPLCEAISAEILLVQQNIPGKNRKEYGPCLLLLPIEKLAIITLDTTVSTILSSGNMGASVMIIASKIGDLIENEVHLTKLKHGKGNFTPWEKVLIKAVKADKKVAMTLNYRIKKLIDEDLWPVSTRLRVASILLSLLVDIAKTKDNKKVFYHTTNVIPKLMKKFGLLKLDKDLFEELVQKDINTVAPKHLPMLVEPKLWDNRKKFNGGAYYRIKSDLMRTFSSNHMEALKRANMKPVLDGLNYLGIRIDFFVIF